LERLAQGTVIPAHPLALDEQGRFDRRCQRALTRYYAAAGAGGVAVGVHTTQFAIRNPAIGLLRPVLHEAAAAMDEIQRAGGPRLVRVCGICGRTEQAVAEALQGRDLGYHVGLLSLAAMGQADDSALIAHCRAVAAEMPLMGFYLQTAVGGRPLGFDFWREFAAIDNVVAVKMAPFNRYQTIDVIRGVVASGRAAQVALYTGNDDNIVADLLTPYEFPKPDGSPLRVRIAGGLLGHWAVWTQRAVEYFRQVRCAALADQPVHPALLGLNAQVTDANAALFDVVNNFAGCIAGIQYVLHRQGLLSAARCLEAHEVLSPGQAERIERVRGAYGHLLDDDFVAAHRKEWLS
jgi:hypothetical protein